MRVMKIFGKVLFALNVSEWEDGVSDYFRTQRFERRHTVFVTEDLGNVSSLWVTPPIQSDNIQVEFEFEINQINLVKS